MSNLTKNIKSLLSPKEELNKKQIALFLTQSKIDELDEIVKNLSQFSNGKVNRNILIEMAIDSLIESIPEVISEYQNENNITNEEVNYNTILIPSHVDGIDFINKNKYWEYVKINKEKLKYLHYLCLYIGTPISAIKYYMEIDYFEEVIIDNQRKYRIYIKGKINEINPEIPLGNLNSLYTRSTRFLNLDDILNSKEYSDILKK